MGIESLEQYTFNGVCKGTTKDGQPCRRRVVYANGFCKAHGGDSTEYAKVRLEELRAKSLRRAENFNRKLKRRRIIPK